MLSMRSPTTSCVLLWHAMQVTTALTGCNTTATHARRSIQLFSEFQDDRDKLYYAGTDGSIVADENGAPVHDAAVKDALLRCSVKDVFTTQYGKKHCTVQQWISSWASCWYKVREIQKLNKKTTEETVKENRKRVCINNIITLPRSSKHAISYINLCVWEPPHRPIPEVNHAGDIADELSLANVRTLAALKYITLA